MNIYIGNLSQNITEDKLKTMFAEFGDIESVKVIKDRFSGRPKGYGLLKCPAIRRQTRPSRHSMAIDWMATTSKSNPRIQVVKKEKRNAPFAEGRIELPFFLKIVSFLTKMTTLS